MMGDFHFLRPWWLLALIPCALMVCGMYRHRGPLNRWRGIIAGHLLPHLMIQGRERSHGRAVALIASGWVLCVAALAGPAWSRERSPFANDAAGLVVVLKVAPSMQTQDVQPDRLARSVQKVRDLLAMRSRGQTGLVVYAGSVHVVSPMTSDGGIISTFAQALDPKVMPVEGDVAPAALAKARKMIDASGGPGAVLWMTDGIDPGQAGALAGVGGGVSILAPLLPGAELDKLKQAAEKAGISVVTMTPDDGDVRAIGRTMEFEARAVNAASNRWHESGYALVPVILVVWVFLFRKGVLAGTAQRVGAK